MPLLLLYRFRYRNPRTGKRVTARYRATIEEIERRCGKDYALEGEPEMREGDHHGSFNPWRPPPRGR